MYRCNTLCPMQQWRQNQQGSMTSGFRAGQLCRDWHTLILLIGVLWGTRFFVMSKIVDTSEISSRAFGHSSGSEQKSSITFCCIRVFRPTIVILYLLILYPALKNSDYIELLYLLQSINVCCSFISNHVVVPAKRHTGSSWVAAESNLALISWKKLYLLIPRTFNEIS